MARQKQAAPLRREPSDFKSVMRHASKGKVDVGDDKTVHNAVAAVKEVNRESPKSVLQEQAGVTQLLVCVAGIYMSL